MYLFSIFNENSSAIEIYNELTDNDKLELTQTRLFNHLLNIYDVNLDSLEKKEIYDYSDLKSLNLDENKLIKKSLVNKFVTSTSKYLFTVNPYDNIEYDEGFIKFSEDMLSTLNKNVILDFGEIENNIIYLVLAQDLLESIKDRTTEYVNSTIKL